MWCEQSFPVVPWTVFFMISFSLICASPASLFQGAPYSGAVHRHRNKNWCAYIVQKNVSCAVQGSVESFVEPEPAPCPINQPDCVQQMMYRTRFRPTYRISYKTVTELEWRCCPGYQGGDCKELRGVPRRQIMLGPHTPTHPGQTRHVQRPERRQTEQHDILHRGVDKARQLEDQVQRLSQTVQDLQATMASITENLRTDLQEDTSKMLVTLLNNLRPPDSAKTGGTEESVAHLDGHQATRGQVFRETGMEEVMARLNDVTDALKSKDEELEEIRGTVTRHDGQIRVLMDDSQGPLLPDGAPTDLYVLQTYIDGKFEKLQKDLVRDVEDQMTRLKSTCDDKILSVERTCEEGQKSGFDSLAELVGNKEADLRRELRELQMNVAMSDGLVRTHRQTTPMKQDENWNGLRKEVERVAEAHRVLNARVDNELEHLSMLQLEDLFGPRIEELEDRMNVTERNAETYSFYVEERLSKEFSDEIAKLRRALEERLEDMEDQFTTMLVEMSNNSFPGLFSESTESILNQVNSNKYLIQGMEDRLTALGHICSTNCKPSTTPDVQKPGSLENILRDVHLCRNDLDVLRSEVSDNTDKMSEIESIVDRLSLNNQRNIMNLQNLQSKFIPLENDVSGLKVDITAFGDSMSKFSRDIQSLNATCCLADHVAEVPRPPGTPQSQGQGGGSDGQTQELRHRLQQLHSLVTTELIHCRENATEAAEGVARLGRRLTELERVCGETGETGRVPGTREGLEGRLADLGDRVGKMNSTLGTHSADISNLQRSLHTYQTQLSGMAKLILKEHTTKEQGVPVRQDRPGVSTDSRAAPPPRGGAQIPHIHIPLIFPQRVVPGTAHPPPPSPRQPYRPQQPTVPRHPSLPAPPNQPTLTVVPRRPVLETGEAGPPGYRRQSTVRRNLGHADSGKPVEGYAGMPSRPLVRPVAFTPNAAPVVHDPWYHASKKPVATQVASNINAMADPFSFSAGLTQQAFTGDFGIIRFNNVLVNDGGHYNAHTGIFTVPTDGRYLVTAILTAPRGGRVEAVLSVSNRSVQKLDTAGYWPGAEGLPRQTRDSCPCGGSTTLSLILSLRRGDGMALVRTAGQLAVSESKEMLSTFSAIFLYPTPGRT